MGLRAHVVLFKRFESAAELGIKKASECMHLPIGLSLRLTLAYYLLAANRKDDGAVEIRLQEEPQDAPTRIVTVGRSQYSLTDIRRASTMASPLIL